MANFRNRPCPCGSGKKYKHCHLGTASYADIHKNTQTRTSTTSEFDANFKSEIAEFTEGKNTSLLCQMIGAQACHPDNQRYALRFSYLLEAICSFTPGTATATTNDASALIDIAKRKLDDQVSWAEIDTLHSPLLSSYWYKNKHYYFFTGGLTLANALLETTALAWLTVRQKLENKLGYDLHSLFHFLLTIADKFVYASGLDKFALSASIDYKTDTSYESPISNEAVFHAHGDHLVFMTTTLNPTYKAILDSLAKDAGQYRPRLSEILDKSDLYRAPVIRYKDKYVVPMPQHLWYAFSILVAEHIRNETPRPEIEYEFWKATMNRLYYTLGTTFGKSNVLVMPKINNEYFCHFAVPFDNDKIFQFIVATSIDAPDLQKAIDTGLKQAIRGWANYLTNITDGTIDTRNGSYQLGKPQNKEPIRILIVNTPDREIIAGIATELTEEGIITEIIDLFAFDYLMREMESPLQFLKFLRQQERFLSSAQQVVRLSILDSYGLYQENRYLRVDSVDSPTVISVDTASFNIYELNRLRKNIAGTMLLKRATEDFELKKAKENYFRGFNPITQNAILYVVGNPQITILVPKPEHFNDNMIISISLSTDTLGFHVSSNIDLIAALRASEPFCQNIEISVVPKSNIADSDQTSITFEKKPSTGNNLSMQMLIGENVFRKFSPEDNQGERYILSRFFNALDIDNKLDLVLPLSVKRNFQALEIPVPKPLQSRRKWLKIMPEDEAVVDDIIALKLRDLGAQNKSYLGKEAIDLLIPVHDAIQDRLCSELQLLHGKTFVEIAYEELENLFAFAEIHRMELAIQSETAQGVDTSLEAGKFDREIAIHALSYRYMMELAVKLAPNGTYFTTKEKLGLILAMAMRIVDWDFYLEYIHRNLMPMEVHVSEGRYVKILDLLPRNVGESIMRARGTDGINHYAYRIQRLYDETANKSDTYHDLDKRMYEVFDPALKEELGYTLDERFEMQAKLLVWFERSGKPLRIVKRQDLIAELEMVTGYDANIIDSFMKDIELTHESMIDVDLRKMWPAEQFWRDLRVLNRPLVHLPLLEPATIIYGYQTSFNAWIVFIQQLASGTPRLNRISPNGRIASAIGTYKEKLGDRFRDQVKDLCIKNGLEAITEKNRVKNRMMRTDGLGPVDIFCIDRKNRRFLVIEAKDVAVGIAPKDIQTEKERFLGTEKKDGYISTLLNKLNWLQEQADDLKEEYGILRDEEWTFTPIIVTSGILLVSYLGNQPIPITNLLDFETSYLK